MGAAKATTTKPAAAKAKTKSTKKVTRPVKSVTKKVAKPAVKKAAKPAPRPKKVSRVNPLSIIATGLGLGLFAYSNRREGHPSVSTAATKTTTVSSTPAKTVASAPAKPTKSATKADEAQAWIENWKNK